MKRRLFALFLALTLTLQLATPVFAEEVEETQATTEAVEVETEAPATEAPTEAPTTEPPTTAVPETVSSEETSAPTQPQATETTETTPSTEETTTAATEPTEETTEPTAETTEPTLDLFAEDENVTASGECGAQGDNLTWTLSEDGTLTISGTGAMKDYDWDDPAPWKELDVTQLVLEEGVTSIGIYAFRDCDFSEITLPSTLKTIGEEAATWQFSCHTLHIPAGVTSIGHNALSGNAWDEITVDPENHAFKVMDGGLYSISGNRLLAIEEGEGEFAVPDTVTRIDTYAFWNCNYSAIHLGARIPGDLEANSTLTGTRDLEAVTVSESNPNLKAEDGVLFSADGKRLIYYPRKKQGESYTVPAGVETLGSGAFHENSYLAFLTLPEGLKEIDYQAIFWCNNLKSITIPASVTKLAWHAIGYTENDKWDVVPIAGFTIYGHGDGAAKNYAKSNGFAYIDLDNITDSGECGNDLTWTLTKDGTLTISGTGAMWDYDWDDSAPWRNLEFKKLVLGKGITHIGSFAFAGYTDMTGTVTIPEGVTTIGESAFLSWIRISGFTLPSTLISVGESAFAYCGIFSASNYTINIPANLENIGVDAFGGSYISKATMNIGNKHFKVVGNGLYNAEMTRLLVSVGKPQSFTIPDSVIDVDPGAFVNGRVESLHVGAKVSAPLTIPYSLTQITVSDENPNFYAIDNVLFLSEGNALVFYSYAKTDKSYTVPYGTTRICERAFHECYSLTEVILPNELTTIEDYAFVNCENLKSIEIPASVTQIGEGALGYIGGEKVENFTIYGHGDGAAKTYAEENDFPYIDLDNTENSGKCGANLTWTLEDGVLTITGSGAMKNYTVRYYNNGVTRSDCPWYGKNITELVLNPGITTIGSYAFYDCEDLTSVELPKGVTAIGEYAFFSSGVNELTLPNTLKTIGKWAFAYCNINSLHIPASVTSIGESAFCGAIVGISEITVDPSSRYFTVVDGGLYNKSMTRLLAIESATCTSFVIPDTVSRIDITVFHNTSVLQHLHLGAKVPASYFSSSVDSPLKSITVSEKNAELYSISGVLFAKKGSQLLIYPRESENGGRYEVPAGTKSIATLAFWDCPDLTELVLPEGLTTVEAYATVNCTGLKRVEIPASVKTIGDMAFGYAYGPDQLEDFTIASYCGSPAEAYAKRNAFDFDDLDFLTGECGDNLTWTLHKGVLTISGEGDMWSYSPEDPAPWQDSAAPIRTVDIKKGVTSIGSDAFGGCGNLKDVYYGGSKAQWRELYIEDGNERLTRAAIHYGCSADAVSTEIRPVETDCLTSGSKLTLTAWTLPDGKKIKAKWSLSEDSKAYAAISSSGVLTAKTVSEVQNITVIATPTDGSPEARKIIQILPKITVKQTEKFNLFYRNGSAELSITGGEIEEAQFVEPSDFVLENNDGKFDIRLAQDAPAKPKTKVTLEIKLSGCDTPIRQNLTIATTNTAPKLKLNPTVSIVNTTLTDSLTVEAAILGTEDETLTARSATKGVTASIEDGVLTLELDTDKTTTANVYIQGDGWAKEVKVTHKITVTNKKPTVKFTAKGKLDVLNPESEIVYTPKLTNATGTITDIRLEGQDADLFHAEVVDGLIHLTLAKPGGEYSTKKTYKVTPTVTLLGKEITGSALSVKVTQSTLKLAKIPNQAVSKSAPEDLTVYVKITSPLTAEIGDVKVNAKTTAALRNALEAAGGIEMEEGTVSFPAETFTSLKPGKYTVILDVTPANAASNTKPTQAKFTLTVRN